jgi:hypothetical protein
VGSQVAELAAQRTLRDRHHRPQHLPPDMVTAAFASSQYELATGDRSLLCTADLNAAGFVQVPPRRDKVLLPLRRGGKEGSAPRPPTLPSPRLRAADQTLVLPCRAREGLRIRLT